MRSAKTTDKAEKLICAYESYLISYIRVSVAIRPHGIQRVKMIVKDSGQTPCISAN